MTTFIDDGMLEDGLNGPGSDLDNDECTIVHIDDINATIEDPGYILEDSRDSETEKYTSSYGKPSFTLPVTFFDISRNISLLMECRPISVRIVDCKIYPRYYKKVNRENKEKCFDIKDEKSNRQTLNSDTEDLIIIQPDDATKKSTYSTNPLTASKFNLSLKRSQDISKLKQGFERVNDVEKTNKNINVNVSRDTTTDSNRNKIQVQSKSDKTIEDIDLLKYKAIAERIVRNIDKDNFDLETDEVQIISEPEVFNNDNIYSKHVEQINIFKPNNVTPNKKKEILEDANKKIITSPILPCKIRLQKKAAPKTNTLKNIAYESTLENCSNLGKCCGSLTSSADRVIPHSHYRFCRATDSLANHFYYMNMNRMMSQYYAAQQYVGLNETFGRHAQHQSVNQFNYMSGNNDLNFVYPQTRFTPHVNSSEGFSTNLGPTSSYEYSSVLNNLPQNANNLSYLTNRQVVMQNHAEKIKPTKPVQEVPYSNVSSTNLNDYQRKVITGNEKKSVDISERNVSNENFRVISGCSSFNSSFVSHSICPLNLYNTSTRLQIPKQVTVASRVHFQRNPLLTQMLNEPPIASKNNLPIQKFTQSNNGTRIPSSVIQHTSGIESNENNISYSHLYPRFSVFNSNKLSSTFELNIDNNNVKVPKIVEKPVSLKKRKKPNESKLARQNQNRNIHTETNNIPNTLCQAMDTVRDVSNTQPANAVNNKTLGLNSRATKSRQISCAPDNTELNKILNLDQQFNRPNVKLGDCKNLGNEQIATVRRDIDPKIFKPVSSNINSYSPAILPILTFEKSLQMISQQYEHSDIIHRAINSVDANECISNIQGESNIRRKRQHSDDMKCYSKIKKISLQEYKERVSGTEKVNTKSYVNKEIALAKSLDREDTKDQNTGSQNVDIQDLGYDSDSTVVLDICT